MQKPFNALSGWELKQLILGEVKQRMALDARFESTVPVPGAFLVFTVQVEHKSAQRMAAEPSPSRCRRSCQPVQRDWRPTRSRRCAWRRLIGTCRWTSGS